MHNVLIHSPLSRLGSFEIPVGMSLAEVHARAATELPCVVVLNGAPVMRSEWSRTVAQGDEVALLIVPAKGGFKQILGAVALIALAVVAPQIGIAIAGTAGALATGISAGIVLAGSILVNALLAPSSRKGSDLSGPAQSPTYSLSADGNQARLLQPIPRLYGRHIFNPDYAAKPYSYYLNGNQYLCQLFCLGVGQYDLEEIRIGKTTMWRNGAFTGSYAAIELVKYEPGQQVALFTPEVETSDEVTGQELNKNINVGVTGTFQQNTVFVDQPGGTATTIDTKYYVGNYRPGDVVYIDAGSSANTGEYNVIDVDKVNFAWVMVDRVFPQQGSGIAFNMTNINWSGPYVVNPPRTQINKIELDYIFPAGLNRTEVKDGGPKYTFPQDQVEIEYRQIDGIGQPITGWTRVTREFAFPIFGVVRVSSNIPNLTPGRYQVRQRRVTVQYYGQGWNSTIQWAGLKGYYVSSGVYPDVTLLAIRIRADNQISSQNSRKFSTIQTAKLPTWTGSSWTAPVTTRRISDAFLDALRNNVYGVRMPDNRIDLNGIMDLEEIWTARGDTFDGVFDTKYTSWDALAAILFVGRAKPIIVGGVITAVRDQSRVMPRAVFSPFNIKQNSFELEHVMNDTNSPTDAIVSFMDERTWTLNEVECYIDNNDRDNPARIEGFGIVKRAQAWREGIYQVASNKYRRVFASFNTELEGKLLLPMDKIVINHDLPRYGQSGAIDNVSFDSHYIYSTEPFDLPTSGQAYVGIRQKNGKIWGPVKVKAVIDNYEQASVYLIDADGSQLVDMDGSQLFEFIDTSFLLSDRTILVLDIDDLVRVERDQGNLVSLVNVGYNNEGDPGHILFGTADSYVKPFRIVSGSPRSEYEVAVICCNEDDRVHTAEIDYNMPTE